MRDMYFAMETMSVLILLVLLYANYFEIKQHSKKQKIFSNLLILNLIVVIADAISWLDLGWKNHTTCFWILVTITYIIPFFIQALFSKYVCEHICEKTNTSRRPFIILSFYCLISAILIFVLCCCNKIFTIVDGIWHSGPAEIFYYLLYLFSLIYILFEVLLNSKKLGFHDTIAALLFCLFPLAALIISITGFVVNLNVPLMGIDLLVIFILLQSDTENKLLYKSNNDELTGLYNRRAYEDDMMHYPDVPPEADFSYASIDVNGLKLTNDTFGHSAGDELICGASACLKRAFGNYGKIYRTGGDEFVAIFFANEQQLKSIIEDVKTQASNWKGKTVTSLALSVGCVSKREFPDKTVTEMTDIADKRMYEEKAKYYATKGVDRRGQSEAHKVLCSLYTKILKINITDDTFTIVNMNTNEQTEEKGFGRSGCVHSDDLEDYLAKTNIDYMSNYFKRGKTSLSITYRRKYDDGFKQIMMEIIPTKDYSHENQSLFLYVKNIDL